MSDGKGRGSDRSLQDRDLRDQDRREEDADEERRAETERRGEQLKEAWRQRHPERGEGS